MSRTHKTITDSVRPKRTYEENDWELQMQEDFEDAEEFDSVFIVVNEFTPAGTSYALRDALSHHKTIDSAWEELRDIALELGVHIGADDFEFPSPLPADSRLSRDEYYIEERILND